jgi:hypothetical protein
MFFTKIRNFLLGFHFFILSANSLWAKKHFQWEDAAVSIAQVLQIDAADLKKKIEEESSSEKDINDYLSGFFGMTHDCGETASGFQPNFSYTLKKVLKNHFPNVLNTFEQEDFLDELVVIYYQNT